MIHVKSKWAFHCERCLEQTYVMMYKVNWFLSRFYHVTSWCRLLSMFHSIFWVPFFLIIKFYRKSIFSFIIRKYDCSRCKHTNENQTSLYHHLLPYKMLPFIHLFYSKFKIIFPYCCWWLGYGDFEYLLFLSSFEFVSLCLCWPFQVFSDNWMLSFECSIMLYSGIYVSSLSTELF